MGTGGPHRLTVTRRPGSCTTNSEPIDNDVPITLVRALYNDSNEVYMVDTSNWDVFNWLDVRDNPLFLCITGGTSACVISERYVDFTWLLNPFRRSVRALDPGTVDVLVNTSRQSFSFGIPTGTLVSDTVPSKDDIGFNTCLPKPNGPDPDEGFSNYRLMVHEAGHALGLSNWDYNEPIATHVAHPSIPDSVMNYDSRVSLIGKEPDCSPHPFDIMAIEALYRTVVP